MVIPLSKIMTAKVFTLVVFLFSIVDSLFFDFCYNVVIWEKAVF